MDFVRFPLGTMTKAEVRAAAREFGLAVADKHDSQDICFVPNGKYTDVIERLRPDAASAGDIVHIDGRVLGRHNGIIHYTIGQRRGIGVAVGEPLYVVHLDPAGKRVIVGPREALATRRLHLRGVNWLGEGTLAEVPAVGIDVHARVRSTRAPLPARLLNVDGHIAVDLGDGESGVAPGQACVLYDGDGPGARVLGGGFIEKAEHARDAESALRRLMSTPAVAAAVA
jgi:tRNA-specific 2-thiouridylase